MTNLINSIGGNATSSSNISKLLNSSDTTKVDETTETTDDTSTDTDNTIDDTKTPQDVLDSYVPESSYNISFAQQSQIQQQMAMSSLVTQFSTSSTTPIDMSSIIAGSQVVNELNVINTSVHATTDQKNKYVSDRIGGNTTDDTSTDTDNTTDDTNTDNGTDTDNTTDTTNGGGSNGSGGADDTDSGSSSSNK